MSAISPATSTPSSYLSGMEISWRGGSYSDDGSVPGMISSASLQSIAGDIDDCSLSSSATAQSSSPRSIFQAYWSSAAKKKAPSPKEKGRDGASARARKPPLTAVEGGPSGAFKIAEAPRAAAPVTIAESAGRKEPFDDASVDYQSALRPLLPAKATRRRILPPPPPPTPLSSSLLKPRKPQLTLQPYAQHKSWSTTALLPGRRAPHPSCLRKTRSTVGALGGGAEPKPGADPKKSVSFHSRVSVLEFAIPPVKSHTEWYDHFT